MKHHENVLNRMMRCNTLRCQDMVAKLTDVLVWEKLPLSALSKVCSALAWFIHDYMHTIVYNCRGQSGELPLWLRRAQVELPKWI